MRLVSVDIGNGYVKAKAGNTETAFAAIGAMEQGAIRFDGLKSSSDLVIDFQGERWALGSTAYKVGRMQVSSMGRGRIIDENYPRLYAAALATTIGKSANIAVIASLPVQWYTGEREKVRELLAGKFVIGYDNQKMTITIDRENVHIVPEGFGSLCTRVLGIDGRILDAEMGRSVVGVVDIGTRTTDLLYFDNLELYPARSSGLDLAGMAVIWTLVGEQITQRYGRELSALEIDEAIHKCEFRDRSDRVDISDLVESAAKGLAAQVSAKISSEWDNGRDVDTILITGGAAEFIYPYLKFSNKMLVADPFRANVEGAYRFGLLRGFGNGS
jgi:hypothetical protein